MNQIKLDDFDLFISKFKDKSGLITATKISERVLQDLKLHNTEEIYYRWLLNKDLHGVTGNIQLTTNTEFISMIKIK